MTMFSNTVQFVTAAHVAQAIYLITAVFLVELIEKWNTTDQKVVANEIIPLTFPEMMSS